MRSRQHTDARRDAAADAIIVAYQSASLIVDCVMALRRDPSVGKIIVVNNSPWEPLPGALESVPRVTLLTFARNLGFGAAINRAREHVRAPFVIVANPDAVAGDAVVTELVAFLRRHPAAALAAPRMVTISGDFYPNSHRFLTLGRMCADKLRLSRFGLKQSAEAHAVPHMAEYVLAAFICCRRAALDEVGWFDETIFLFGEDQDLCRRLAAGGWEVWYSARGSVTHSSGHSWRQLDGHAQQLLVAARYRELRANGHPLQAALYYRVRKMLAHANHRN